MTRPDEPTEALPTRALPITGDADTAEPTVHLPGVAADLPPTAEPTVHLAAIPGADDRTADLAVSATPAPPAAEPTVHVRPGRADDVGEATVQTPGPTNRPGAEPTASWRPTASWQPTGPAATGAGAYPDRTGDARAVSGAPGFGPGGELRFGPGVPATPPPAPPWPTAPPIRPRPVWRRVVSVLSTLLTVVLLLAVGLYLWQRLRPLEVEGVTVAVPRPAGVACDVTVDVVATVRTNGRGGTIRYQWFRSDAPPGAVLTERVGSGQHTTALTLKWTFTGVGTTTGIATVNIIEPTTAQASTRVVYRCPGG